MGILAKNNNLNRANAIIKGIGNKEEEKPELPPVDGIEPNTPPVDAPPVDTPPVDTPPVEGQNTPPVEAPPVEVPAAEPDNVEPPQPPSLSEVPDEVILSRLSETLGRKIESYDDLKPKEIEVDSELKQLLDWKEETGLSLSQWTDYNKDYSKLSDLDVAREILSKKYPDFSREELDFTLQDFIYDEDYDDEKDKMRKNIELKKLATDGRKELEKKKFELKPAQGSEKLTQEQQEAIAFANQTKTAKAQAEQSQTAYENNLKLAAQNLNTISLNLDEGVVIEHKVEDSDKKDLKDYILNVPHWFNEDGTPNHSNIATDGYKIKNFSALMKAAYQQGQAAKQEEIIKGKGNINLDATTSPQGQGDEKKGNIHQVVDKLSGNSGSKFRFRKKGN